jgi:hypothetical protein
MSQANWRCKTLAARGDRLAQAHAALAVRWYRTVVRSFDRAPPGSGRSTLGVPANSHGGTMNRTQDSRWLACLPTLCTAGRRLADALLVAWLWLLPAPAAVAGNDTGASLRPLADDARSTLAERIEAPAARLPFLCTVRRSEGAPLREYVLRQQSQAIEALLAGATSRPEAERVGRLLGELQRDGFARGANARLADIAPGGAIGLRLAASLGELPAALHDRMQPGCGASPYRGLLGRTDQPLGQLARVDYERLTELEAADPWHWLVLAWLAGAQGEHALRRSLAAAQIAATPEALRVQVLAWQQMAWLRRQQGRGSDAQVAAEEAMRLAAAAVAQTGTDAAQPAAGQALRDIGQTGSALAIVLEDSGQTAAAFAVLANVLPLQQRLAERQPDDLPAQYALIDTLGRLGMLQRALGATTGRAPAYSDQAVALYEQLQARTPYDPILGRSGWPGMFAMAVGIAGLLTLLMGWALLWRYRQRVAQLMTSVAGRTATVHPPVSAAARPSRAPLAPSASPAADTATTRAAAGALRQAAVVQAVAGLAFGLAAAWLQLRADGTEANLNRMAVMSWTWAWPTILALGLVWDGDRRRRRWVVAAYFGVLLLICTRIALGETPPLQMFGVSVPAFFQGMVFWAMSLSYSPFLLLFLNRAVRSIGPALLAMMLVAVVGGTLAMVAASTPRGMSAVVHALMAVHLPTEWMLTAVLLAGMLASAPLAWWVARQLRAAYAAKWLTDQSLMIDTLWLFQAVLLSFSLTQSIGPAGWMGLGVFGLHKTITLAGMWPAAQAARARAPLRLLLLRVFSRRDAEGKAVSRRADAERLFDLLGSRWRYAGPIHMIGAPDLASSTIDPDEFLDFLAGRLRERFILDPTAVPERLAALDERCDFDARWRVSELFCGDDAWRAAVLALMARSDLVAMDLRDFGPDNQGCVFELQALLDLVPAQRVALLVDQSTRLDFLNTTIDACLARVPASSPNVRAPARMTQVNIDSGEPAAVNQLLRMATAAA